MFSVQFIITDPIPTSKSFGKLRSRSMRSGKLICLSGGLLFMCRVVNRKTAPDRLLKLLRPAQELLQFFRYAGL